MYSIKEITDINAWEQFVMQQRYSPFVQSYLYGQFYNTIGEQYWILGIYNDAGQLVGGSLILSVHAKRGNFFYLPYGPVIPDERSARVMFSDALVSLAKKQHMDFIRVSPFFVDSEQGRDVFRSLGYRPAPMHVLAENSWLLDVTKAPEVLLSEMKKNHRNLIRRCEREGVRVEMRTDRQALDIVHQLLDETEKRHNFTRFSREYITREFDQFATREQATVFVAYLSDGTIDSAAIIMFYGTMAVYRHSGSLNQDPKIPTSYLIQWHAILEAKKRGMQWYNFWGVEPLGASKSHPFAGIGHFKRGFGGFQIDLLHCHDLPLTPKYWLNWIIETFRKMKRGF